MPPPHTHVHMHAHKALADVHTHTHTHLCPCSILAWRTQAGVEVPTSTSPLASVPPVQAPCRARILWKLPHTPWVCPGLWKVRVHRGNTGGPARSQRALR